MNKQKYITLGWATALIVAMLALLLTEYISPIPVVTYAITLGISGLVLLVAYFFIPEQKEEAEQLPVEVYDDQTEEEQSGEEKIELEDEYEVTNKEEKE